MSEVFLSFARVMGIPVRIDWSKEHTIVTDPIINMYGEGYTKKEALEAYKANAVEYYKHLVATDGNMSEHLLKHRDYLWKKIKQLTNLE